VRVALVRVAFVIARSRHRPASHRQRWNAACTTQRMISSRILLAFAVCVGCSGTAQTDIADTTVAGQTFHVFREGPMPAAGVMTTIVIKPLTGTRPDVLEVWVGTAETEDAQKTTCIYDANDGDFDCDVTCANPLPAGSKIWFEITAGDIVSTGSVDIK